MFDVYSIRLMDTLIVLTSFKKSRCRKLTTNVCRCSQIHIQPYLPHLNPGKTSTYKVQNPPPSSVMINVYEQSKISKFYLWSFYWIVFNQHSWKWKALSNIYGLIGQFVKSYPLPSNLTLKERLQVKFSSMRRSGTWNYPF